MTLHNDFIQIHDVSVCITSYILSTHVLINEQFYYVLRCNKKSVTMGIIYVNTL